MRTFPAHSLAHFDSALRGLRDSILTMSSIAQRNLEGACRGLLERDSVGCSVVVGDDDEVDELERLVDREAMEILIRFAPMADDLRLVLGSMRIASNLERVSDQAVGIARRAKKMNKHPEVVLTKVVEPVFQLAMELIQDGMRAYADGDVDLALAVIARDKELDRRHRALIKEFTKAMEGDPLRVRSHLHLTFVVRFLERIGDHAVNIAEEVVFIQRGEDIRHGHSHEASESLRKSLEPALPLS